MTAAPQDVVERLREHPLELLAEAADEIERLRAANKALVEALTDVRDELEQANGGKGPSLPLSVHILTIVCAALAAAQAQGKKGGTHDMLQS